MSASPVLKPIYWVASSFDELVALPRDVQHTIGVALMMAQAGGKHPSAKPLKGFKGAGVLEIVEDHDADTFRAVYTIRFVGAVYVLIELIKTRLRIADQKHRRVESR